MVGRLQNIGHIVACLALSSLRFKVAQMSEGYPGKGNKTCSSAKDPGKQYTEVYESTYVSTL